jgi:hypothetical protein
MGTGRRAEQASPLPFWIFEKVSELKKKEENIRNTYNLEVFKNISLLS